MIIDGPNKQYCMAVCTLSTHTFSPPIGIPWKVFFNTPTNLFMYMLKSRGDKKRPCLRPVDTSNHSVNLPLILRDYCTLL